MKSDGGAVGLSVAAVARHLGVSPFTLRSWDRRYGVGPSAHVAGTRRRYSPADISRLAQMQRLIRAGYAPATAASVVRDGPGNTSSDAAGGAVPGPRHALLLIKGLTHAALAFDVDAITTSVRDLIAEHGVVRTWEDVLVPVLATVGERSARDCVAVEHVLSHCVAGELFSVPRRPRGELINRTPVLLACTSDEEHSLPLIALGAALAQARVDYRLLGARVPSEALRAAVTRTGPAAVVLWSHTAETGDPEQWSTVPRVRPRPVLLAGGNGWQHPLPRSVERPRTLSEAVQRIVGLF